MFGYNTIPGIHGDGHVPAGLSVDGVLRAGADSIVVGESEGVNLLCTSFYMFTPDALQYADNVGWFRKDNVQVLTQLTDGSLRLWQGLDSRGKITCSSGIGLFGHTAPSSAPTITGSRAAMGVSTYQVIQALAATGAIVDGTTA